MLFKCLVHTCQNQAVTYECSLTSIFFFKIKLGEAGKHSVQVLIICLLYLLFTKLNLYKIFVLVVFSALGIYYSYFMFTRGYNACNTFNSCSPYGC